MTAAYASAAASAVATTVANVTTAKPTGAAVGDKLIAVCWSNNTTALWSGPAGWTLFAQNTGNGMAVYERTVDGTEGADFTFTRTVNTGGTAGVIIVRVTGAGTLQAAVMTSVPSSTNVTLNAVTAAANNLLLQVVTSLNNTADTFTPPGTATERIDTTASGNAIEFAVGDEVVGAGSTGSRTWTRTLTQSSRGALIAVNPPPTQTVTPASVASTAAVGDPTVTTGAVTVTPDPVASTAGVGSPTIAPGAVTVAPDGLAATSAAGDPTVIPGAVTVAPDGIASTSGVGEPTVIREQFVDPDAIESSSSVGEPTLVPGGVNISPDSVEATSQVGDPLVTAGGSVISDAGDIASTAVVPTPTLLPGAVAVTPDSIATTADVPAVTVTSSVTVTPDPVNPTSQVGEPAVVVAPLMIEPDAIPSTAEVGEPTVAEPARPDECWPIDLSCVSDWDDVIEPDGEGPAVPKYSEAQKQRAIALAISSLRDLTGYRVGGCPTIYRPCKAGCTEATWQTYPVGYPGGVGWVPMLVSGTWINVACGCGGSSCSCSTVSEVILPTPIGRISEVKIDGTVLPASSYRLDPGGRLIRTDGGRWPTCQDIAAPDTADGTWSITVRPGVEPDATAAWAAGVLAGEFVKACTGGACRLPTGVTQIARLGVTVQMGTGAFPEGRTGIREVDAWLDRWNPNRLRVKASVYSPDVNRPRVQGR